MCWEAMLLCIRLKGASIGMSCRTPVYCKNISLLSATNTIHDLFGSRSPRHARKDDREGQGVRNSSRLVAKEGGGARLQQVSKRGVSSEGSERGDRGEREKAKRNTPRSSRRASRSPRVLIDSLSTRFERLCPPSLSFSEVYLSCHPSQHT